MEDTPTPIAEIDHGPSKFEAFMEKYQKALIALALIIFLAVLGYVFYTSYTEQQNEQAGDALGDALLSPETAQIEAALAKVVSDYSSSPSATTATFVMADMQNDVHEDPVKSAEQITNFISTYGDSQLVLLAELKLAQLQINQEKYAEAKATLESLKARDGVDYLLPRIQISLGDIAQLEGDDKKAISFYSEAEDSNTDFAVTAKRRIAYLNADKPKIVQPVAPKPVGPFTPPKQEKPETGDTTNPPSAVTPPVQVPPAPADPNPADPNKEKTEP